MRWDRLLEMSKGVYRLQLGFWQAMLVSYSGNNLVRFRSQNKFSLVKFAPYTPQNLLPIVQLLEDPNAYRTQCGGKICSQILLQMTRLLNS